MPTDKVQDVEDFFGARTSTVACCTGYYNTMAVVILGPAKVYFHYYHSYRLLRWLEIVFEIFFTRKQFTFIYIIITFMAAT